MSDDGSYAQSPYDDYEDYYDEEPLDLADDLAQHAAYSPVWQDNPLGELEPYHSDWEYYSDDYYDDDPALHVGTTFDGSIPAAAKPSPQRSQRTGRKRKLDEAREVPLDMQRKLLRSSIRGTVWAQKVTDSIKPYKRGQEETVALLTNWKEVFKGSTGTVRAFGGGQFTKDDTWANHIGLAAMGLQNEHRHSIGPLHHGEEAIIKGIAGDEYDTREAAADVHSISQGENELFQSDGSDVEDDILSTIVSQQHHAFGGEVQPEKSSLQDSSGKHQAQFLSSSAASDDRRPSKKLKPNELHSPPPEHDVRLQAMSANDNDNSEQMSPFAGTSRKRRASSTDALGDGLRDSGNHTLSAARSKRNRMTCHHDHNAAETSNGESAEAKKADIGKAASKSQRVSMNSTKRATKNSRVA